MKDLLDAYAWPSEAYWRYFELRALRELQFDRPILEIGCGSGDFSRRLLSRVDEAIDVNPRAVERARYSGIYGRVRELDASELVADAGHYRTVFANCVFEHIPNIARVLSAVRTALAQDGRLIITVPILDMNHHLLLNAPWYAELRRRQLVHVNLWTVEQWLRLLHQTGFTSVETRPYLYASQCHLWDIMDVPGSLGFGRYRVATAVRRLARLLPKTLKVRLRDSLGRRLETHAEKRATGGPCAVLIIAS